MAATFDEAMDVLRKSYPADVDVVRLSDGVIRIEITPTRKSRPSKGRWARVAEQMEKEAYLDGEAGKFVERSILEFRKSFDIHERSFEQQE